MNNIEMLFAAMGGETCGLSLQCLLLDFKDHNGIDKHMLVNILCNPHTTDETIVATAKDYIRRQDGKLSCISAKGRCLYLAPGLLEEIAQEKGHLIPKNPKDAFVKMGLHPVNEKELFAYWARKNIPRIKD